jgi:molybdopterin-guanine dinucleotide biosynthesis protein A
VIAARAIVLAGGRAQRMGGVDKAALRLGGVSLLDRVLLAARPVSRRLVVVGPARPTDVPGVAFLSEPSPGGGPVPAVLAALDGLTGDDIVLLLAADLPFLAPGDLERLLAPLLADASPHAAAAEVVHADHRFGSPHTPPPPRNPDRAAAAASPPPLNPLLAAYRGHVLLAAGTRLGPGAAARELLPPMTVAVALPPLAAFNVNRQADLDLAAELLAAQTTRSSPA